MKTRRPHQTLVTTILAASALALIASGCSTSAGGGGAAAAGAKLAREAPAGSAPPTTAPLDSPALPNGSASPATEEPAAPEAPAEPVETTPPAPVGSGPGITDDATAMLDHGQWRDGPDACRDAAKGPWRTKPYETDPIELVRQGRLPQAPDEGASVEPTEINEWTQLDQYHDPSTYEDEDAVLDAMYAAGFHHGAEAIWRVGHEEATITAVRYRDAAAAQEVLTTQLLDLCSRAVTSSGNTDRTGMVLVRDSGAMRVLSVLDDTVISVWACSCISGQGDGMGVADWYGEFRELIETPPPDTTTS